MSRPRQSAAASSSSGLRNTSGMRRRHVRPAVVTCPPRILDDVASHGCCRDQDAAGWPVESSCSPGGKDVLLARRAPAILQAIPRRGERPRQDEDEGQAVGGHNPPDSGSQQASAGARKQRQRKRYEKVRDRLLRDPCGAHLDRELVRTAPRQRTSTWLIGILPGHLLGMPGGTARRTGHRPAAVAVYLGCIPYILRLKDAGITVATAGLSRQWRPAHRAGRLARASRARLGATAGDDTWTRPPGTASATMSRP